MRIIDCHCHIYPGKIAAKASAAIGTFYDIPMAYDGTLGNMKRAEAEAGIGEQIVFSVATKPEQVPSINRFIAETVGCDSSLYGLGTVHPQSADMERDMEEAISLGLLGIKIHPDFQKFAVDDPGFFPMYAICERENLPVLIHTGDKRYDYSNFERLENVLKSFPGLKVVGAHFGGWSLWEEAPARLSKYENLFVDCSSSLYAMEREAAIRAVRTYGAERVMFGTDYPMWNPKGEVERVLALGLTDKETDAIFCETAKTVFEIR